MAFSLIIVMLIGFIGNVRVVVSQDCNENYWNSRGALPSEENPPLFIQPPPGYIYLPPYGGPAVFEGGAEHTSYLMGKITKDPFTSVVEVYGPSIDQEGFFIGKNIPTLGFYGLWTEGKAYYTGAKAPPTWERAEEIAQDRSVVWGPIRQAQRAPTTLEATGHYLTAGGQALGLGLIAYGLFARPCASGGGNSPSYLPARITPKGPGNYPMILYDLTVTHAGSGGAWAGAGVIFANPNTISLSGPSSMGPSRGGISLIPKHKIPGRLRYVISHDELWIHEREVGWVTTELRKLGFRVRGPEMELGGYHKGPAVRHLKIEFGKSFREHVFITEDPFDIRLWRGARYTPGKWPTKAFDEKCVFPKNSVTVDLEHGIWPEPKN